MNKWMKNLATVAAVAGVGQAMAVPSGLSRVPAIERPDISGRPMPVEFLGDDKDPKTIWVVPTEGTYISHGLVKPETANCVTLKDSMKLEQAVGKMRLQLAQMYSVAQTEFAKRQTDMRKVSEQIAILTAQVEPLKAQVIKLKTKKSEIGVEINRLKGEISGLTDQRLEAEQAKDKTRVSQINNQIAELEGQLTEKYRENTAVGKQIRDKDNAANEGELTLIEAKGKSDALEQELDRLAGRIVKNKTVLDDFQKTANEVVKMYSKRLGGYASFTFDFTPARYLQDLQKANDGYTFRYVNSRTAIVKPTIPINTLPGSPIAEQDGQMILRMGWSNPQFANSEEWYRTFETLKSLPKELLEGKELNDIKEFMKENPVLKAQETMKASNGARFESSLSGSKFLGLELSVIGMCALSEPNSLESEQVGGVKDTFKLGVHFTYPVHYKINVNGDYNHVATLYEFHKMTKSSSWFGLSKSQKYEHIKRMTNDTTVKIKVDAPGSDLTLDEVMKMAETVRTQLVYYTTEPYLDKTESKGVGEFDNKELGATSTGKRLMLVPNPWAFWGGMVLTCLGEMFGSDERVSESNVAATKAIKLDYQGGYTIMHSGDITVGNLVGTKVKVDNALR